MLRSRKKGLAAKPAGVPDTQEPAGRRVRTDYFQRSPTLRRTSVSLVSV